MLAGHALLHGTTESAYDTFSLIIPTASIIEPVGHTSIHAPQN